MHAYEIASGYIQHSWRMDYHLHWYPAAVFASPYWAALAIPTPDRRHRLFYQRLLAELAINAASPCGP